MTFHIFTSVPDSDGTFWVKASGEATNKDGRSKCYYYDKPERIRPTATAYVVSKSASGVNRMINLLNCHGIKYYEIAENSSVTVKQYGGDMVNTPNTQNYTLAEATLSEEKQVLFREGAYVVPCSQISGTLVMYLFEPDVNDTEAYSSSLSQSGTLTPNEIFRYEHTLIEGKIKLN